MAIFNDYHLLYNIKIIGGYMDNHANEINKLSRELGLLSNYEFNMDELKIYRHWILLAHQFI